MMEEASFTKPQRIEITAEMAMTPKIPQSSGLSITI